MIENEGFGVICFLKNKVNGKMYIMYRKLGEYCSGPALSSMLTQLENRKYFKKNKLLQEEWIQFGKKNFEIGILEEVETNRKKWAPLKLHYIEVFNTLNPENGYNIERCWKTVKERDVNRYTRNKENQREYQKKNKDKLSVYFKKYSKKNKEKNIEYLRKYYMKNREKLLTKSKAYYMKNKERILAKARKNENLSTILKNYQLYTRLSHEFERKFWKKLKDQYNLTEQELDFLEQWDPWTEALIYGNCTMDMASIEETINEMRNHGIDEFDEER